MMKNIKHFENFKPQKNNNLLYIDDDSLTSLGLTKEYKQFDIKEGDFLMLEGIKRKLKTPYHDNKKIAIYTDGDYIVEIIKIDFNEFKYRNIVSDVAYEFKYTKINGEWIKSTKDNTPDGSLVITTSARNIKRNFLPIPKNILNNIENLN